MFSRSLFKQVQRGGNVAWEDGAKTEFSSLHIHVINKSMRRNTGVGRIFFPMQFD